MNIHPEAIDRMIPVDPFEAVRWFRAVARFAACALVAFMPWWIIADAMTRVGR